MKTTILSLLLITTTFQGFTQDFNIDKYSGLKLKDIPEVVPQKQEYNVTIKKQILDPIENINMYADAIVATYHINSNDTAEWHNVNWAKIDDLMQQPTQLTQWTELSNLKYKTKTIDFLKDELYKDIPEEQKNWARMLTADAVIMHEIGWKVIDSLEFKQQFTLPLMDKLDIPFENSYTYTSKTLTYKWSGITTHNNKPCAIIKFESFFNPFYTQSDDKIIVKGRSLYYGELLVSLIDKQIEYSEMIEDVIFNEYQTGVKLYNMQRTIVFEKLKQNKY